MTTAFAGALNGTGRPMWLNFHCLGPWAGWCAAQGNSWRIGPDHHDSWGSLRAVAPAMRDDLAFYARLYVNLEPRTSLLRRDRVFCVEGGF